MKNKKKISLALHGGAGALARQHYSQDEMQEYKSCMQYILGQGIKMLGQGISAAEVVVTCVESLENHAFFNAGKGSVLSHQGQVEMDACLSTSDAQVGAVTGITTFKNPIRVAQWLAINSPHPFMHQSGLSALFKSLQGPPQLEQVSADYFITPKRLQQWQEVVQQGQTKQAWREGGTVGAVALDEHSRLAAATSTGGITGKWQGRISDSSLHGAGNFASPFLALSGTGQGDLYIKACLLSYIAHRHELLSEEVHTCVQAGLERLSRLGGQGGVIAVDRNGEVVL